MIKRLLEATRINEIVNDPSIYPWVCGSLTGPLDLTEIVENDSNFALFGEHGGIIFECLQRGFYDAHTQVLPGGRGAWTLEMVHAALLWMFTKTDAVEISTRVPRGNFAARALVKAVHGEYEQTNPRGWWKDGGPIPADHFSWTIQRWLKRAPHLAERGHWFHEKLETEYARLGVATEVHEDDESHDRAVGAAIEMMTGGQAEKAVRFYNRWAVMAGYEPIKILSTRPSIIDIRDAVLLFSGGNFEVLKCR